MRAAVIAKAKLTSARRPQRFTIAVRYSSAVASCASVTALRLILGFSIISTASHYAHNFVAAEDYPGSGTGVQVAILLSWPLLTALGLYGYRLYSEGRYRDAHICLLLYAPLGLVTPLHFVQGNPDIPPFFYATIFTDGLAGLGVLGFVAWSVRRHRDGAPVSA